MRPIDADVLKHMVESMNFAQPFMDVTRVLYGVGIEIDNAPTIDVVEVVRCKDCKHNESSWCPMRMFPSNQDFCSYGEREGE